MWEAVACGKTYPPRPFSPFAYIAPATCIDGAYQPGTETDHKWQLWPPLKCFLYITVKRMKHSSQATEIETPHIIHVLPTFYYISS